MNRDMSCRGCHARVGAAAFCASCFYEQRGRRSEAEGCWGAAAAKLQKQVGEQKEELRRVREDQEQHERECPAGALERMLVEEMFCDFEIVARGHTFRVHKGVLASRSPVLEGMLNSGMREVTEGRLKVDDIGRDAMWAFLYFLYCGKLPRDFHPEREAEEVLYAAHKYDLSALEDIVMPMLPASPEQRGLDGGQMPSSMPQFQLSTSV